MKAKIIMLSVLGAASFGLTQAASAGWVMGDCSNSPSGPAPCIEWSDGNDTYHFNGDGGHANDWHKHPVTGNDFPFAGTTDLSCPGLPTISCTLTLDGDVKKFDDGGWKVGIRVNNNDVTGGLLCGAVAVGGHPWYLDQTSEHTTFNASSGIDWPAGSLVGNFGNIDVSVLGGSVASNTHMHDVTYNNTDTFSFDGNLYENGTEVDTGCSVVGDLELQPSNETLTIK